MLNLFRIIGYQVKNPPDRTRLQQVYAVLSAADYKICAIYHILYTGIRNKIKQELFQESFMSQYAPISGVVTNIAVFPSDQEAYSPCALTLTVQDVFGSQNTVILEPSTYVLNQAPIHQGDPVIFFYDTTEPMPLIFPPLHRAVAAVKPAYAQSAYLDTFGQDLVSSDGLLKIELSALTDTRTQNGQIYEGVLADHLLLVLFGSATRSIPAQTTAEAVTVFCC